MSLRPLLLLLIIALTSLSGRASASEEAKGPPPTVVAKSAETTPSQGATEASNRNAAMPFDGRKWSLGVTTGYYAPMGDIFGLEVNPFGFSTGVSLSWMTNSGFWFGAQGTYHFGRTLSQVYKPPLSSLEIALDAKTSAANVGVQLGVDLRLDPVVIRYSLDIGASIYSWDFGDIPYLSLAGYSPMKGTIVGLQMAPGFGVLIPLGKFFVGTEIRYRIETSPQIPGSFGGQLHLGWRP